MIDINAFAGPWPFRALPASAPADVADLLQESGIARALVSSLEAPLFEDPQVANERLAARLQHDGFLLLCAALNPALAGWEQSLQASRDMLDARAVKLHPNYHGYDAGSEAMHTILAAAGEAGLPVIVQLRMQDIRAQHALCKVPDVPVARVLDAAAAVPGTNIVLGGVRFGEVRSEAARIRSLPNVFVDLSQVEHADGLRQAIAAVGFERLLLGTAAPLFNVRSTILKLDEGLLSDQERGAITRANARTLLGV